MRSCHDLLVMLGGFIWCIGNSVNFMSVGAVFSDAANKALRRGLREFIKEDWKKVFEPENVQDQIFSIT